MLKAVLFDLDGTLLPMNDNEFTRLYFGLLCKTVTPLGYDSKKLVDTLWTGTSKMYRNDGSKTNEEVFWDCFAEIYGKDKLKDKPAFDRFYSNEFKLSKSATRDNPIAKEIIDFLKNNNIKIILATNPLFPPNAIETRISFINLVPSDFDYITTYDNSHFTKPNPKYIEEILNKNNLKSEEVLFFGNNEVEDCDCASALNIKSYLVGDDLILKSETPPYPHIKIEEIIDTIKSHM